MATSETAGLIRHIQENGDGMDDQRLSRILGVPLKRLELFKSGEQDGTRTINAALGILASRVGYDDTAMTEEAAHKIRVGDTVEHNGEPCQVLNVKKTGGFNAPYFSLLGEEDIYVNVSFRFCSPWREPAEVSASNGTKGKGE